MEDTRKTDHRSFVLSQTGGNGRQVASGFERTKRRSCWTRWTLDNVLKFLTAISICTAGMWALYLHHSHQEAMETKRSDHQREMEDARNAHEQYMLAARIEDTADAKLKALRTKHKRSQAPILIKTLEVRNEPKVIRVLPDGRKLYEIWVRIKLENKSEVELRTSVVIFDFFLGTTPDDAQPNNEQPVIVRGTPPHRWGPQHAKYGVIDWDPLYSLGGINSHDDNQECKDRLKINDVKLIIDTFATSHLLPGYSATFTDTFRFEGTPGQRIGIWAVGRTNGCKSWKWFKWRSRKLP